MRIMLVCMSGITTNVLAGKLQAYGGQQGKGDFFLACKIGVAEELLPGMDLVLVAPQARFSAESVREAAASLGIAACDLDEEDFVLGRLAQIYEQVDAHRPAEEASPESGAGGRLGIEGFMRIGFDAFISCVPFLAFGISAWLFHCVTGGELSYAIWQVSAGIFSLYLLFAVGCHYGERMHRPRFQCGAIALASSLLMLPTRGLESAWLASFRITVGTIPISFFSLRYSPALFALALLSMCLLDCLQRFRVKTQSRVFAAAGNLIEATLQGGCVFAVFLLLRFLLERAVW